MQSKRSSTRSPLGGATLWFLPGIRLRLTLLAFLYAFGWCLAWVQMASMKGLALAVSSTQSTAPAFFLLVVFISSALAVLILEWVRSDVEAGVNARGMQVMEGMVLGSILRQEDAMLEGHSKGKLLSRLKRDLIAATDRRLDQLRSVGAVGDIAVALLFLALSGEQGSSMMAGTIGVSALAGGLWARSTFKAQAKASNQCRSAEDEVLSGIEQLLHARTEIRSAASFDAAVARLSTSVQSRADGYVAMARSRAKLEAISSGAQLLTLSAFFGLGHLGYQGLSPLLPVVLREVPKVFGRSTTLMRLLARLAEGTRALNRLLRYDLPTHLQAAESDLANEVADAGTPTLAVENLTLRYKGPDGRPTGGIRDISFALDSGVFAVLVGESGGGKSTLIRVLSGLQSPDHGSVKVSERDLLAMDCRGRAQCLSLMPQSPALIQGTIRENLTFASEPWKGIHSEMELLVQTGVAHWVTLRALSRAPSASAWAMWRSDWPMADAGASSEHVRAIGPTPSLTLLEAMWEMKPCVEKARKIADQLNGVLDVSARERLAEMGWSVFQSQKSLISLDEYETFASLSPCLVSREEWLAKTDLCLYDDDRDGRYWMAYALISTLEEIAHAIPAPTEVVWQQLAHLGPYSPHSSPLAPLSTQNPPTVWIHELARVIGGHLDDRPRFDAAVLAWLERHPHLFRIIVEEGLSAPVGESGQLLSGGQRQMVALCRILRRNAPLVILDEPTSALDEGGKRRVAECLRSARPGRILLAVTHDDELVEAADFVLRLASGELVVSNSPTTNWQTA